DASPGCNPTVHFVQQKPQRSAITAPPLWPQHRAFGPVAEDSDPRDDFDQHLQGGLGFRPSPGRQSQDAPTKTALEFAPLPALQEAAAGRGHEVVPGVTLPGNDKPHLPEAPAAVGSMIHPRVSRYALDDTHRSHRPTGARRYTTPA